MLKKRHKVTFILSAVFLTLALAAMLFSLSCAVSLAEVRADQLVDEPGDSWEDDLSENLSEGLSEAFLLVFILFAAVFGGVFAIPALVLSAVTIKGVPKGIKIPSIAYTAAAGACLLWFSLGTFALFLV